MTDSKPTQHGWRVQTTFTEAAEAVIGGRALDPDVIEFPHFAMPLINDILVLSCGGDSLPFVVVNREFHFKEERFFIILNPVDGFPYEQLSQREAPARAHLTVIRSRPGGQ